MPHAFIRAGGTRKRTFTIGDGKDILTDATRVCNVTNRLQQSSKMKAAAARGMSWCVASPWTTGKASRLAFRSRRRRRKTLRKKYPQRLALIHISEPTRLKPNSYAVFCLKKKKKKKKRSKKKQGQKQIPNKLKKTTN